MGEVRTAAAMPRVAQAMWGDAAGRAAHAEGQAGASPMGQALADDHQVVGPGGQRDQNGDSEEGEEGVEAGHGARFWAAGAGESIDARPDVTGQCRWPPSV